MKIEISEEHAEALKAAVTAGTFGSVDEAVSAALDQLLLAGEDLSWAKPLVEEAMAEFARGEGIQLADARAELRAHRDRLKS